MKATVSINKQRVIDNIDDRIYGSFIEHLGRAVYGGIYEPGHPTADGMGFRGDVMELVRALKVPIVRYPGGNFVSGYRWEDGIGDRSKRPRRMELAWQSVETNEIGIDEFQEWAKRAGCEIMMAVNLGTRGPEQARDLVEYCNGVTDTEYANLRRKNGFEKPFAIRNWCLGNEMDGPWQMGAKTPYEYARVACEAAKLMKWTDPSIELTACGSSNPYMPTFGEWERTVLRECYDHIDFLSLHSYYGNPSNDSAEYLSQAMEMDAFIKKTAAICDEIKAEKRSNKTVKLSFDEWNVWFHSGEQDRKLEKWQVAPPMLEDVYNLEDAVVVGDLLITLLKNCDRVKMACLAQLVNVIAPIMTKTGGGCVAQTIYYPYLYTSLYGRGSALSVDCECGGYDCARRSGIPYVDAVAALSPEGERIALFAVNRSLDEACTLELAVDGFDGYRPVRQISMEGDDLKAVNTVDDPARVTPVERVPAAAPVLAPHSWNLILMEKN